MDYSLSATAFAKINIGLSIGPKSQDSFHPIVSLFQSVSLGDDILLDWSGDWEKSTVSGNRAEGKPTEEGFDVSVDGDFDCPGKSTTLFKAAAAFLGRLGISARLKIRVEKRIPAKAGLGGGSADAAALLVLLDKAFGTGLETRQLAELGLAVGSDVPFFFRGGTALVHGRGELIETLPSLRDFGILLIHPPFGVSTPWAYAALDRYREQRGGLQDSSLWDEGVIVEKKREIIKALGKPLGEWKFGNDFSSLLYKEYPVYRRLESFLRSKGADFVAISGSGSSIFGLFGNLEKAQAAKESLGRASEGEALRKLLYGMRLHALKPLETSLRLG
jgi:4-diphosphocytidyl-2-C-methyl-D-erythritol kinase